MPLVRDVDKRLQGIVVVAQDSPIQSIKELNNKMLAFPSPNALGATLLVRSESIDKYGLTIIPRYVQTHSSVYLNVVLDEAVAGGGVQKSLEQQSVEIQDSLRVLYRTQSVAPHPIVASDKISESVRERVRQALMDLSLTEQGQLLLSRVPIKKLGTASLVDYQPLKSMGLERFHSR